MSERDKKSKEWKIYTSRFEKGRFSKAREVYSHKFKVQYQFFVLAFTSYSNFDTFNDLSVSEDSTRVEFCERAFYQR